MTDHHSLAVSDCERTWWCSIAIVRHAVCYERITIYIGRKSPKIGAQIRLRVMMIGLTTWQVTFMCVVCTSISLRNVSEYGRMQGLYAGYIARIGLAGVSGLIARDGTTSVPTREVSEDCAGWDFYIWEFCLLMFLSPELLYAIGETVIGQGRVHIALKFSLIWQWLVCWEIALLSGDGASVKQRSIVSGV